MTRRRKLLILKALLLLLLLGLLVSGIWPERYTKATPALASTASASGQKNDRASSSNASRLRRLSAANDVERARIKKFKRAEGSREWRFPRDHGQHPAYRLEWWYYTGIVSTEEGRRFGYQVTFFRQGLRPGGAPRPGQTPRPGASKGSAWTVGSLYLAHAAVSDLKARRFHRADRLGRDSLGLSGAAPDRHTVWLGTWRADALTGDPHGTRLVMTSKSFALRLTLRSGKGPVLHGVGGLDKKGDGPGQASWYYSMPRLATEGTLTVEGKVYQVRGFTWMDHEFGTGQLPPGVAGWDWLALRLDDGSDLMLYRLRRKDGGLAPGSAGSLIDPQGRRREIRIADRAGGKGLTATLTPGGLWRSKASGGRYPLS